MRHRRRSRSPATGRMPLHDRTGPLAWHRLAAPGAYGGGDAPAGRPTGRALMTQWDGHGLPPVAAERMRRFASTGLRTSLLTVPGAVGEESVGFDPGGGEGPGSSGSDRVSTRGTGVMAPRWRG